MNRSRGQQTGVHEIQGNAHRENCQSNEKQRIVKDRNVIRKNGRGTAKNIGMLNTITPSVAKATAISAVRNFRAPGKRQTNPNRLQKNHTPSERLTCLPPGCGAEILCLLPAAQKPGRAPNHQNQRENRCHAQSGDG